MRESPDILSNQGIELAANGDYPEAIVCFMTALQLDKDNHYLWFNLGVTYQQAGMHEAAKNAFATAHKLNPDDEEILEALSVACFANDEIDNAFFYSMKALQLNIYNPHVWNNLGVFWFNTKDYDCAAHAFEEALSLYPHYEDALINLRDTYEAMENDVGKSECVARLKELQNNRNSHA